MADQAEIARRLHNVIQIGTIHTLDHDNKKLRVAIGKLISGWLPWPASIGRNYIVWQPLRTDTQVILACPDGDTAQAVIIGQLYSQQQNSPSTDENTDQITFNDGTQLSYDSHAHHLTITSIGDITMTARKMTLQGDIEIVGDVTQTSGDVVSAGISLQKHTHISSIPGSSSSGPK